MSSKHQGGLVIAETCNTEEAGGSRGLGGRVIESHFPQTQRSIKVPLSKASIPSVKQMVTSTRLRPDSAQIHPDSLKALIGCFTVRVIVAGHTFSFRDSECGSLARHHQVTHWWLLLLIAS